MLEKQARCVCPRYINTRTRQGSAVYAHKLDCVISRAPNGAKCRTATHKKHTKSTRDANTDPWITQTALIWMTGTTPKT